MLAESKPPPAIKRPVITLTSDFGERGHRVGAVKGSIVEVNPNAALVDITHQVPRHDLLEAALTIRSCYYDFPLNTIHLLLVDPHTGPRRRPILVKTENYYFMAPDNGVLSFIYQCERVVGAWHMNSTHYFRKVVNPSFYARDVYGPSAGYLSKSFGADDFGEAIDDFARINVPTPQVAGKQMKGFVLMADGFGNLITNFESADLIAYMQAQGLKRFQLKTGSTVIAAMAKTYGEGDGQPIMLLGGSGYLEIAVSQKSAEQVLGAKRGQECLLEFE